MEVPQRRGAARLEVLATAVGAAAISVAVLLSTKRQWACNYRYWSDGGRNSTWVLGVLAYGGTILTVLAGVGATITAIRSRRYLLLVVAVAAVAIASLWLPAVIRFGYDCSTE